MSEYELLQHVDNSVKIWGDILVPIYTNKEFHDGQAFLLGTGFLAEYGNEIFLVTAYHVLEEHYNKLLVIVVEGKSICLSKMPFLISKENDLAVSHLRKDWMAGNGLVKVKAIPLENKKEDYLSKGRYFLIGFPGTKNTLNKRVGKNIKNIYGISFESKN